MPRGNVRVRIEGDSDGLSRETRKAETALERLNRNGSRSMKAMGTAAKGAGLAVAAGLAFGLKQSVDAALEAEKSQARLQAQLKASGISWQQHRKEIELTIQKHSQLSGLDDEELQDAFTNIVRVTGDVSKSLRLTGLAADFARAKHIDVAKAGELVGKVAGGNLGILSRYGITLEEGATKAEALAVLQQKFGGQAEAYGKTTAGSLDRMNVAAENLAESVGSLLAPAISSAADTVSTFITQIQNGAGAGGAFADSVRLYSSVVKKEWSVIAAAVGDGVKFVNGFLRDNRETIRQTGQAFRNIGKAIAFVFAEVIFPVVKRVMPGIRQIVQGVLRAIGGYVKIFSGIFTGDFRKMWEGVKQVFSGGLKAIGGMIRAASAPMRAAAAFAFGKVRDVVSNVFSAVRRTVGDVIEKIAPAFRTLKDVVSAALAPLRKAYNILKDIAGIASKVVGVLGDVGGVVSKIPGVGDPKGWRERMQALVQSSLGSLPGSFKGGTWKWANQIAGRFGLHVTSSYRDPKHNAAVGGVPGSLHTHGSARNPGAIDLVGPVDQMNAAAAWARANIPGIQEVLVHDAGSGLHLHLGFFAKGGKVNKSGLQVVGEKGPEIVSMPVGTEVFSHSDSRRMVASMAGMLPGFQSGGMVRAAKAGRAAGFSGEALKMLLAIGAAESVNYTQFIGDGGKSHGPWQIHVGFHPEYRGHESRLRNDWTYSARAAYKISSGGTNWGPWSVYNSGAYRAWLDEAAAAIAGGGRVGTLLTDAPRRHIRGRSPARRLGNEPTGGRGLDSGPFGGRDTRTIGVEKGSEGGGGGGGTDQALLDALAAQTAATEAHTQALTDLRVQQKRNEDLIRAQGPSLTAALIQTVNGGIGGNAGLGRQFPSSIGLGGLARA